MAVETAWEWLFRAALAVLACSLFSSLFRSIRGPRIADRIMAVNMAGKQTPPSIAARGVVKGEGD